jgi:magnesium and cobalt transporter
MTSSQDATPQKSWLDKLSHALRREPQDREDLLSLLKDANERSLVDGDTLSMLESVLLLSQLKASDIMIPKQQMIAVTPSCQLSDLLKILEEYGHSRYPIINDGKDDVLGILHAKDLIGCREGDKKFSLNDLMRPATIIPESKRLNVLLTEFRHTRTHMAIVVDEYGIISGLVTIEDILEQIVGDIEDEFDSDEDAFIKQHENGKFVIKGHISVVDFNEYFCLSLNEDLSESLGGLITKTNGHLPKAGETVMIDNHSFSILNADNRRIKLVEFIKEGD